MVRFGAATLAGIFALCAGLQEEVSAGVARDIARVMQLDDPDLTARAANESFDSELAEDMSFLATDQKQGAKGGRKASPRIQAILEQKRKEGGGLSSSNEFSDLIKAGDRSGRSILARLREKKAARTN